MTLRDCQVVWGQQQSDYVRHALEMHGASHLVTANFRGMATHPERDAAMVTD